jgi:hypothetical protein
MAKIGIACLCFASTLFAIPRKRLIQADMHQATNAVLSSLTEQQPIKKAEALLLRWRKLILMDLHDGAARATINSFVLLLTGLAQKHERCDWI